MAILLDNFTDTNGTLLSAHTSDNGVNWGTNSSFKIHDNRLYQDDSSGNDWVQAIGVATTVKSVFTLEVEELSDTGEFAIQVFSTATNNGIFVQIFQRVLKLWTNTSGTFALQDSYTLPAGTSHTLEISSTATAIAVSHNGVNRLNYTDSGSFSRTGGVYFRGALGGTTTTGYHLDRINITDAYEVLPNPHSITINHNTIDIDTGIFSYLDTFTDADTTTLPNHISDTNESYEAGALFTTASNRIYPTNTNGSVFYEILNYQSQAEYKIEFDVHYFTQLNAPRICFAGTSNDTFYSVETYNDQIRVFEWSAGLPTSLGTYTLSASAGDLDRISCFVTQKDIQVYYGTTKVITSTDVTHDRIGKAYIGNYSPITAVTTSTGYHIDRIKIGEPTATSRTVGSHTLNVTATAPDTSTNTATGTLSVVELTITSTVQTATNRAYVTIGTPATEGDRITATPVDLATGDQLAYDTRLFANDGVTPTAYTVSIDNTGVFTLGGGPIPDDTYYIKDIRVHDNSDSSWGALADQTVTISSGGGGGGYTRYKDWMESLPVGSWTTKLRVFLEDAGFSGSTTRMLYEYLKTVSEKTSHQERKKDWEDGGWG